MTDSLPLPAFSPGVKRTHDGFPVTSGAELTPQTTHQSSTRDVSPAPSGSSSSLSELTAPTPQPPQTIDVAVPAAKKPKLTFAEKQTELAIQRVLKEERAKLKAEEKAKKEDEKREAQRKKAEEKEATKLQKEIEKAEKEAEKAEKQKVKDAEKAKKDADKAKKEAEKAEAQSKKDAERLKKERSQMRLGAFFGRPAVASTPPTTPDKRSVGPSSRRSSVASIDMAKSDVDSTPAKDTSQFSKWILPFFVLEHTELAPSNRFMSSNKQSDSGFSWLANQDENVKARGLFRPRRARVQPAMPVKEMMDKLNGSAKAPIDLTANDSGAAVSESLKKAQYKIIRFREDVRPPYQGTYTRAVSPRSSRKLSRMPTYRGLPDTDYDYDSEAEWQEPEPDDEDLEGDDDESEEEEGADEMDDFLDDEADTGKRQLTSSDVEPVSTGLCWEGQTEPTVAGIDLGLYRMQVMHDDQRLPIDPYSSTHWKETANAEKKALTLDATTEAGNAMQPPRLPLANVSVNSASPSLRAFVTGAKVESAQKEKLLAVPARGRPRNPDKPVKTIPDELLPSFKTAIEGSDLNKIALVEILKKQFPKCSKDAIKGTLDEVAMRMGVKEADKRWVLR